MNGSKILQGSTPFVMAYAGHQFGYFVPQLGHTSYKFGKYK
ncbi:MAG: hypothetical protein PHE16_04020 [Aliarcobacter sp.]|nr:hypothetical protein [Aliarcobacter sp.]